MRIGSEQTFLKSLRLFRATENLALGDEFLIGMNSFLMIDLYFSSTSLGSLIKAE